MNGNTVTVEELGKYCQQLCEEGKGGARVKAGMRGREDSSCDRYEGDVVEVMFDDGELRLDVEQEVYLSRKYLIALLEEVQKSAGCVSSFLPHCAYDFHDDMEDELNDLHESISSMMTELRED